MRLVMVEWIDSFGCSSDWQELSDDYQPQPIVCRSVGWLFRDGSDCKVLVPHIADIQGNGPRQGCGDMTIPANSIQQMHDFVDPAAISK